MKPEQRFVPITIFNGKLSPAEALVKHLREHHDLRFTDIAKILNRDQRGIWCAYKASQKKEPTHIPLDPHHILFPVTMFSDRNFSILEHIVIHLREKYTINEISKLLNKHPSTISTIQARARRKQP